MRWCAVRTALARHAVEEVDEPEPPLAEEQLHDVIDLGDAARAVVHGVEIRQLRHRIDLEE